MSNHIPEVIGVIGAGTMGAGIAQLAGQAGVRTLLHDPVPAALERGIDSIAGALERLVSSERMSADEALAVRHRIEPATEFDVLAECGFVIEAAPERLELKLELFTKLAEVVPSDCVLATNTSSLSVTEIAAHTPGPERVVGLHFFNPAPVMRLVELVAGQASSVEAIATARAVGQAMGKHVINAADIPGFLVNRCNRPFSLESLRLLTERVATVEQIDRIVRLGGGFRMGPFELMDLIGIDVNHAVAESLYRQTYGEPRYQPSPLQARMIAAGRLGRKTRAGWHDYDRSHKQPPSVDPEPPAGGDGGGRVVVVRGELPVAGQLLAALSDSGFDARHVVGEESAGDSPWLTLICDGSAGGHLPRARLLFDGSLHMSDPDAVGFHVLPPFADTRLVEVTTTRRSSPLALKRTCELVGALGRRLEHVGDAPGLVLGRIICQLINEAMFVVGEGNGTPEDVDAGLELGANHPRGPVSWSKEIGLTHIESVLAALHRELGDDRYRVAPLLRHQRALGN